MFTVKIGFVPSNWDAWDGNRQTGKWAGPMRDRCVAALAGIPGLDLVVPSREMTGDGCVSTVEQARQVLDWFQREKIQGLIVGNMTFGMEVAVGAILSGLPATLPVLHVCTRSGPIGADGSRSTDTWCGQFMTVSAIKRRGFTYVHVPTCNPEEPAFRRSLETFTRAVCAVSRFRGARLGQIGTRPLLFESQGWDEQDLQRKFGQTVVPMDLDTAFSRMDAVGAEEPEVLKTVEGIRAGADEIGDAHTARSLVDQARYEVALRRIARELGVQAMAVSCWTRLQERYGISACSTFGRLNDQGIITACEVDLLGAASMWAVHAAALGRAVPDFIDWTDLHPTEKDVWLAWHCGNAAPSLAAPGCKKRLLRNERMIQWCPQCHGALEFRLKPGPVTCARLVEYGGEYTFFFGTGEVVDIPPFVRGAYAWVRVNDLADWERKMVEHGVIHHGTLIHDPMVADALDWFCKFLGIHAVRGA
jgi:L-fucose isomerase-like protein